MADHILVVEDSTPIRRLVEICLRGLGPSIVTVADGYSALASARSDPPTLVVLDIGLPGIDGWEVLAALRAHPNLTRVPVLVLTAHADERRRFDTGIDEADAFMIKPFEPSALVSMAGRLLRARSRSRRRPVAASQSAH